jgi:hypothetical protein
MTNGRSTQSRLPDPSKRRHKDLLPTIVAIAMFLLVRAALIGLFVASSAGDGLEEAPSGVPCWALTSRV